MAGKEVQITRAERRFRIAALLIYWLALVLLSHIHIPRQVQESAFPDKTLHVLAYMGLTMLIWGATRPTQRVDWRDRAVWLVMVVVVLYGLFDEWSQSFVAGRTTDPMDLAADIVGAGVILVLMRFLLFWDAATVLLAGGLIVLTNISRIDLQALMPAGDYVFYTIGYGAFAAVWGYARSGSRWTVFWAVPSCLILGNILLCLVTGKGPGIGHVLAATTTSLAILAVTRLSFGSQQ